MRVMATLERPHDRESLYAPTDAPEARMSAEQYDGQFGDPLRPTPRVELVRGRLIQQPVPHLLHGLTITALMRAFFGVPLNDLELVSAVTSTFGQDRFEPDLMLVRPTRAGLHRMLDRSEIHLAIEVAVSTLAYDRDEKTIYYAEGGVPEYWIVNPVARQIEVYRTPVKGRYSEAFLVLPGEMLDALCLPGIEIATDSVLPSAT
ncbi:Uma2 family endonuclease [bacterium]|nr:MAG: Uma2 family endonuclease [bacterium]